MNVILFDNHFRNALLPFTFLRPVAEIRVGILTIREKWEYFFNQPASFLTESYLQKLFPLKTEEDNLLICGASLPTEALIEAIKSLKKGFYLIDNQKEIIAYHGTLVKDFKIIVPNKTV